MIKPDVRWLGGAYGLFGFVTVWIASGNWALGIISLIGSFGVFICMAKHYEIDVERHDRQYDLAVYRLQLDGTYQITTTGGTTFMPTRINVHKVNDEVVLVLLEADGRKDAVYYSANTINTAPAWVQEIVGDLQ